MSQNQETDYSPKVKAAFAGTTLAATLPLDVLAHLGPTGIVVGGILSYVAWRHGPEIYSSVSGALPFLPQIALASPGEEVDQPEQKAPAGGRSLRDRMFGIREQQEVAATAEDPPSVPMPEEDDDPLEEWINPATSSRYQQKALPQKYNLSEELRTFRPTGQALFLGRSEEGPVTINVRDIWHVAFAGATGAGKSKIARMIFAQLIALNMQCYLCDPHYAPHSVENDGTRLDWTPIEARLAHPVLRKKSEIAKFLQWLAFEELERRIECAYRDEPVGAPLFVFIDELASIIDKEPMVAKCIGNLLREGRKYRICLMMAAQDLLVKTIGLDTGMQQNIRTGYYGGSDMRTAKMVLKLQAGERIDEKGLGGGVQFLKTHMKHPVRVRIPWPDDEAIYKLCGMSRLPVRELVREQAPAKINSSPYAPSLTSTPAEQVEEEEVYEEEEEYEEEIELSEREQQYEYVLRFWEQGIHSIRPMMDALREIYPDINFNQTRELLEEMSQQSLIPWKRKREAV